VETTLKKFRKRFPLQFEFHIEKNKRKKRQRNYSWFGSRCTH